MPTLKLTGRSGGKPNFEAKNLAAGEAELFIYDEIGPDWAGLIGAQTVANGLKQIGDVQTIYLRVNSPGGSIWEANAIYSQLVRHSARVVVDIDGIALSAASYIAMAGDEIRMSESAVFMIHDPWIIAWGDSAELRATADRIDKDKDNIVNIYAKRTGGEAEQISQWMSDETWFNAQEAHDAGFVDTITEAKNVAASFDPERFKHPPANLVRAMVKGQPTNQPTTRKQPMSIEQAINKFKADHADAYNQIREQATNEAREAAKADRESAVNAAKTEGFDEGTANERERVLALTNTFASDPDFLKQQIEAGHDVAKAKAEHHDVLAAKVKELEGKNKKADDANVGGGTNAVNTGVDSNTGDPADSDVAAARAYAEKQNRRK